MFLRRMDRIHKIPEAKGQDDDDGRDLPSMEEIAVDIKDEKKSNLARLSNIVCGAQNS